MYAYVPPAPNGEGGEVPKLYSAKVLDIQGQIMVILKQRRDPEITKIKEERIMAKLKIRGRAQIRAKHPLVFGEKGCRLLEIK